MSRTRKIEKANVPKILISEVGYNGFGPFSSMAEAGYVKYVEGDWNKTYFTELEQFDGSRKYKRSVEGS